jgi:hypothetical protein
MSLGLTVLAPTRHRSPADEGIFGPGVAGSGAHAFRVMLRASPPLTVGQASHYYRSEFSLGDY